MQTKQLQSGSQAKRGGSGKRGGKQQGKKDQFIQKERSKRTL